MSAARTHRLTDWQLYATALARALPAGLSRGDYRAAMAAIGESWRAQQPAHANPAKGPETLRCPRCRQLVAVPPRKRTVTCPHCRTQYAVER